MPLTEKRSSDAINIILKLFESIARDLTSINIVRTAQTQQTTTNEGNFTTTTDATQPSDVQETISNVNLETNSTAQNSAIILGMFGNFKIKNILFF